MNLAPGTVLQEGKYKIDDVLGIGGFGITYRATHTYLGQTVVLKTLNNSLRQHTDFALFQQQFVAEAQRLSWCQHPNIVRLLDFFEEAGLSFIVMDYIPCKSLAQLVKAGQPLPEAEALHYIRQIASALRTLHQSGLLHRDIKPENIIRRAGTHLVMLIDFGIAREFTPDIKSTHSSLLSSGYAPIEHYVSQGEQLSRDTSSTPNSARPGLSKGKIAHQLAPTTDIYGLAATFYYLLAGERPVAAPLRDRVALVSLREFQPQISPAVEQAILWGLEMDASRRPQTVENWLEFLEAQQLEETQKQRENHLELPIFPSSSLILFLFLFTAGLAGAMGFDLARRYTGITAMNRRPPADRAFPLLENSLHPEFRSQDPSAPLFGEPSVQGSPNVPLQWNKPPKENSQEVTVQPTGEPVPEVASSPAPTPASSEPEPEPEQVQSYSSEPQPKPEPEPEQAQSYSPAPVRELPPEPAIAPAPVPVPEVAPLPPEPPESPASTPPVSAKAPVVPEAAPEPAPVLPPQPEPEPLLPSLNENSGEGSVRSQNPQNLEPVVPFPEPASN